LLSIKTPYKTSTLIRPQMRLISRHPPQKEVIISCKEFAYSAGSLTVPVGRVDYKD